MYKIKGCGKLLHTDTCKQKDSRHGKISNRSFKAKIFNKDHVTIKRHNHKDKSQITHQISCQNIQNTKQTRNARKI